jgi:hypothetical protein
MGLTTVATGTVGRSAARARPTRLVIVSEAASSRTTFWLSISGQAKSTKHLRSPGGKQRAHTETIRLRLLRETGLQNMVPITATCRPRWLSH